MKLSHSKTQTSTATSVSVELLAAAIESAKDSIVITDSQLDEPGPTIIYANAAFTEMTGYPVEEIIGKNPRFLQGPETDRRVLDDIRHTLSNDQLCHAKTVNYRKDGSTFINEWHIEPIVMEESQTRYFLSIQHDVTEQEMLYQQLESKHQAMHELLQQIEWEKQKVKEGIASTVAEVLLPFVQKLKCQNGQIDDQHLIALENSLRELHSGLGCCPITNNLDLSLREIEVAQMIRQGVTTKAIAQALNVSIKTIETHRSRIRKKLGVRNPQINLSTHLRSL